MSVVRSTVVLVLGSLPFWCGVAGTPAVAADQMLIKFGANSSVGVDYVAAETICSLINQESQDRNLLCTVEANAGSVATVNAILSHKQKLGIILSDVQYNAYKGLGRFQEGGPRRHLRALFSIYPEVYTAVARANLPIHHFPDFKGRTFNIGHPGAASYLAVQQLLRLFHVSVADFPLVYQLTNDAVSEALCDGTIDGFVIATSLHSRVIDAVTKDCHGHLIPLDGPTVDAYVSKTSYLERVVIPGNTYPANPDPIATFGVIATVVTLDSVPEAIVHDIVKAVFSRVEAFRSAHPGLDELTLSQMRGYGNTAPVHPGALRYFRELGEPH